MSIDLKIELSKKAYIEAVNEINSKYDLPLSISEIILSSILDEITNMKNIKIAKELEENTKTEINNNKDSERKDEN